MVEAAGESGADLPVTCLVRQVPREVGSDAAEGRRNGGPPASAGTLVVGSGICGDARSVYYAPGVEIRRYYLIYKTDV